jgi:hypothetical protein
MLTMRATVTQGELDMNVPVTAHTSQRPVLVAVIAAFRCLPALVAVVAVLLASACSGDAASSSPPSGVSESEASPSPPVSYDGAGYRFTTPPAWMTVPPKGTWEEGNYPDIGTPGFAEFFAPNDTADIAIGRRPTARGTTLQSWIKAMTKSRTILYPDVLCRPPSSIPAYRFKGEAAQLRVLRCPRIATNAGGALVLTVHHGYGYALLCFSKETGASTIFTEQCLSWLSTFRFTA